MFEGLRTEGIFEKVVQLRELKREINILYLRDLLDDEADILETIHDILDMADVDRARDYDSASEKIRTGRYDLAILDIMGVNGLLLLAPTTQIANRPIWGSCSSAS